MQLSPATVERYRLLLVLCIFIFIVHTYVMILIGGTILPVIISRSVVETGNAMKRSILC